MVCSIMKLNPAVPSHLATTYLFSVSMTVFVLLVHLLRFFHPSWLCGLGKALIFSEPQFPLLEKEENRTYLSRCCVVYREQ